MKDPYANIANAVILQAVNDYRKALKRLKINNRNKEALSNKRDCERFFRSNWYRTLTSVDGEMLIIKLKAEVM